MKIIVVVRYLTVIGLLISLDYCLAMNAGHELSSYNAYERMFKEEHYEQWCLKAFESIKFDYEQRRLITKDVYDHRIGQLATNIRNYITTKKDPMLNVCEYIKDICTNIERGGGSKKSRLKNHPNYKIFKEILKASDKVPQTSLSCEKNMSDYQRLLSDQEHQKEEAIGARLLEDHYKMIECQKKREQVNIWLGRSAAAILVAAGACVSISFALEKSPSELVQLAMESIADGIGSLIDEDLVNDFFAKLTFFNETELDLAH